MGLDSEKDLSNYPQIVRALYSQDIESFIENINNFFTSHSYSNQKYQENTFQIGIVTLLHCGPKSLEIRIEERSFKGRSDIVAITSKYIYIIEIKLDKNAEVGMEQMKDKKYYQSYLNNENYKDKGIVLISISFNSKTKEVKDYLVDTIR